MDCNRQYIPGVRKNILIDSPLCNLEIIKSDIFTAFLMTKRCCQKNRKFSTGDFTLVAIVFFIDLLT